MCTDFITSAIGDDKEYKNLVYELEKLKHEKTRLPAAVQGLCGGALETFIAAVCGDLREGALVIVPDEKTAAKLRSTLAGFFESAEIYPKKDFIFMNMESANNPFECERLKILDKISNGTFGVVISTLEAALQFTIPREKFAENIVNLKYGGTIDNLEEFLSGLVAAGYKRAETVEVMGRFSVRGGIIDIFSPSEDYPVRLELFGDEIDSMGFFDPISQRRIQNIREFRVLPVSEIIMDKNAAGRCAAMIEALLKNKNTDEKVIERLYFELDCLKNGEELSSKDRFIPLVYEKNECLFDYFDSDGTLLFINESVKINEGQKAAEQIFNETVIGLVEKNYITGAAARYSYTLEDFNILKLNFKTVIADMFLSGYSAEISGLFSFVSRQSPRISEGLNILKDDLENLNSAGYKTALFLNSDAGIKSLCDTLGDFDVKYITADTGRYKNIEDMPAGYTIIIKTPRINDIPCDIQGFELPKQKFALVAESNLPDIRAEALKKRSRAGGTDKNSRQKILSFTDLTAGDYVVHSNYGIGLFMAIERLDVSGGVQKDFIKIKYAGSDILYVPCNQLDLVSKYIGAKSEDRTVKLSKMGGQAWQKAKSRAKSAAKNIAEELIKLYAARQLKKGHAFAPDSEWQKDFESLFEYAETEDQLICAHQIKADMQQNTPMDRLLCGDVGFGKTEVALRAVFKCVSESKQAAVLVPTTILAWQHYQTILSRFREFPVKADMLSRFVSKKEQLQTLKKLKSGELDIIIGTHRIIQNDIKFKDLGLLIVDEEHRFGVAHKEKIKQLSESVDVLTLTATPIPRTLNMALTGIRDMSVIEEAPRDRVPVQTYIFEYDENIVREAVKNEIRRGGRVFYLHNRVETIEQTMYRLKELCGAGEAADTADGIRFAAAHGQMDEEELSSVWRSMISGEIDVLVCTTIIESGIDIPEANTLIIENADRLGLAQLHQIRGRVGRSNRRAYAYLTYPKNKVLTEIAAKRLQAVREYTEFGAGFKIALRDLEIRGAGNLLGSRQHGAMEGVGYDLYVRILEKAVADRKKKLARNKDYYLDLELSEDDAEDGGDDVLENAEPEELEVPECLIDISVDAFIPQRYIESELLRIEIYKRIAAIENPADADDLQDELVDRFGDVPGAVGNLINIALIRNSACAEYIDTIETRHEEKNRSIVMYISALGKPQGQKVLEKWTLAAAHQELKGRLLLSLGQKPHAAYFLKPGENILVTLKLIMRVLSGIGQ
ncbi:MAG: transcription-repair coupling factor [Oscillospiraceae bacterium]|nr:transcription-repair coupling factor [Oscillospiraceae bacterium]